MDSSSTQAETKSIYRERLQQAKRVMQGLSDQQRVNNFSMNVFAISSDLGVIACIAGHCGLDPWFQERGFVTRMSGASGYVNIAPERFFGTEQPFYPSYYSTPSSVTFDEALSALDSAIARFCDDTSGATA